MKHRVALSALSSQLHPPLQIPSIPSTASNRSTVDAPAPSARHRHGLKLERPGYTQQYLFALITFRTGIFLRFGWLRLGDAGVVK